jgi:FlaA1/EpsC-like NDP-sugar epimerase
MTISDAVSLVLKSASLKINGKILVLNMGDPINIYELIKSFLRENKLIEKNLQNKDGDIEVKLIGLRKGEKLHEELFYSENYMKQDEMIFSEDIDVKHKNINILEFEKTLKEKIIKGTENEIQSFLKDFTNLK